MIQTTRADGAIIQRPENDEDRKLLRQMYPKTSKFIHFLRPAQGQMQLNRLNSMGKSQPVNNNRKVTNGRRYKFMPVVRVIGSAMHAVQRRFVPTGVFKKVFAKKEL